MSFHDRIHEDDHLFRPRGFAWKISAMIALVMAVTYLMKEARSWRRDLKPHVQTEHERLMEIAPIDLNTATLDQLALLPHINDEQASAIIGMRPITNIDQLDDVFGIGKMRLGSIRPHVFIEEDTDKPVGEP